MKHVIGLVLIAFTFLVSCNTTVEKKKVNISHKDFLSEINTTQNLVIEFNLDLIDDRVTSQWTHTEFIKFDPPIAGEFIWGGKNRLIFSPFKQFPAATTITGVVTEEVLFGNKKLVLGEDISFTVSTAPLVINDVAAYWSRVNKDTKETPTAFFDMNLNYPVNVKELSKKLTLRIGEENHSAIIDTEADSARSIKFHVENLEIEDKRLPVSITIQPGIIPLGGFSPTKEKNTIQTDLNSIFNFSVSSLNPEHDGEKGTLAVVTSQQLGIDDIKKYIEVTPKIKYSIEIQESGFLIKSESFLVTEKYELKIKKGIEGDLGGLLKKDYVEDFSFGTIEPTIRFKNSKAKFLSKKGFKNVKVQILNVPEVEVTIHKLYENNALSFLSSRDYYYDYDTDEYEYRYNYNRSSASSDVVWSNKIKTADLVREGSYSIINLDFIDKLEDYQGIYIVKIKSTEDRWLNDNRLISISDLGLITKLGENKMYAFVNSLANAKPMANAKVNIIGTNNQRIATVTTNAKGVAIFDLKKDLPNGFTPRMVTVSYNGDYNLIDLNSTNIQTSRYDVGGKYLNDKTYEGFIFMERDLYRPGEKASLAVIVRDRQWGLPGEIPVKIQVRTPNGKNLINVRRVLGNQGETEMTFDLPTSSLTGNYDVAVYTSNNQYLTSKTLKVEEFLPDRIKVESSLDKDEYLTDDEEILLDLSAVNFFGPPATDKNYQVRMQWSRSGFYPPNLSGYNFNYYRGHRSIYDVTRDGTTDDEGEASLQIDIPSEAKNTGIVDVNAFVTVFDETGRPVSVKNRARIYTQDVFFGLKSNDYWVKTGNNIKTQLIAVDKDGKVLDNETANVKIIRHEYKTVLARSGSYYRYRSQKEERIIQDQDIVFSGKNTEISFIPEFSGQYEVRIYPPGLNNYISKSYYAYGYGSTTVNSFEVSNEGEVDIIFDKENYAPGETAKVILKAPFSGTVLVTIESEDIQDYFYINTDNRSAQFELPIKGSYLPNVFVSATLFKPQELSDMPLTVAHGYAPIKVDKPTNKLDVEITAVKKSKSNTTQKITLKTKPNTMIGLAVVDEGILQVSNYRTPDPYDFFYSKRALGVKSYDMYPYLFPEVSGSLSGGGDGLESELKSRVNPMNNNRVKLVSYWKHLAKTNSQGILEHTIDIPQFSGDLRIMAVAFNNSAFGSAKKNMKVADPIVISPGIPRFLSPKDSLIMPVAISNTSEEDIHAQVNVSVEGLITIDGKSQLTEKFLKGKEKMLSFDLSTANDIGTGKIKIEVKVGNETYSHHTDITIRPNSPLLKETGSGVINGNENTKIDMVTDKFISNTIRRKLVVSKSPMTEFTKDLTYLLKYPHGCIEQTTSQGFPLLYYDQLSSTIDTRNSRNANYIVQEVIKRIYLMQLYSGGFSYWPGNGKESKWGSVYATHFLVEARRAGYEVDATVISKALKYLKKEANEKRVIDYYYNYNKRRSIYPRANVYALYVLALAGDAQLSTMNFYLSKMNDLTSDSRHLLSAAYALSGDKSKQSTLIQNIFKPESQIRSTGGSFYSPLRDEAMALTALLDIDPKNSQVPIMAKHVSEALKGRSWFSTQERAFSLIALGRIAKETAKTNITADIKSGDKVVANFENSDQPLTLTEDQLDNGISINTSGTGTLYYFWETQGISKDGSFIEEDKYLKVRRTFYHEDGRQVNLRDINQNDRLIVKLSILKSFNKSIENIVITDVLPACFEIENPRFGELPAYSWIGSVSTPDYFDFRDDRVHVFTDLYSQHTRNYYYMVRAVSKGKYNLGPVGADAMYNNEYHSYHGGGIVIVK